MSSTHAFAHGTRVERAGSNFETKIPDGWQQGRGAFGGLVLGTLTRAMEMHLGDPGRALRSLSGDLCGPALVGAGTIEVTTLRTGSKLSNLDARLTQAEGIVARASAVFSAARKVDPVPAVAAANRVSFGDWREIPPAPVGPPMAPVFAQHYEYRAKQPPFTGGSDPFVDGFVRLLDVPTRLGAPEVIGLLDAWWPAIFSVLSSPRKIATASFAAELMRDPASIDPAEPLYYRGRVIAENEGFFVELRELHARDGVVALNQQTFVMI
ncbi:MAG: thioesterase family protein [Polyangiaceae bacterium]